MIVEYAQSDTEQSATDVSMVEVKDNNIYLDYSDGTTMSVKEANVRCLEDVFLLNVSDISRQDLSTFERHIQNESLGQFTLKDIECVTRCDQGYTLETANAEETLSLSLDRAYGSVE